MGTITVIMKKIISLAVSLLLIAGLTGCGEEADSTEQGRKSGRAALPDVIKIAVAGPMTDSKSQYGKSFYYGAQLKADELNKKGGVLGKEIEILVYDDRDTVAGAEEVAGQIAEESGVAGVLGHMSPEASMTAAEIYNAKGVVNICPAASTDYFTSAGEYIFAGGGTIAQEADAVLDIAVGDMGKLNIGLISVNSDWGTSAVLAVKKAAEERFEEVSITALEQVDEGAADYSAAISNLKAAGADVIVAAGDGDMLLPLAEQCSQAAADLDIVAFPIAYSRAMVEENGQALNRVRFPLAYFKGENDKDVFAESFKTDYGMEPGAIAAQAYDSAGMLVKAIESARSIEGSAVMEKLKGLKFDGVTGESKFDENRQISKSFTKFKIEDGKLTDY